MYRWSVELPRLRELSKLELAVLANIEVPSLPKGTFLGIGGDVYFFKHSCTAGCRDTKSRLHRKLPGRQVPTARSLFFPYPRKLLQGAGYSYFAPELPVVEEMEIDDTGISLKVQFHELNPSVTMSLSEENRVESLTRFLTKNLPTGIKCSRFSHVLSRFTPFTGGGI